VVAGLQDPLQQLQRGLAMFRKLFFLALAGVDDDSKSQWFIGVDPKILDNPWDVIIVNAEFVARQASHWGTACIQYCAGSGHNFDIRTECRSVLGQRRGHHGAE